MRRSKTTDYKYADVLIYEFESKFFVLERCQQGVDINPTHGPRQNASENAAVSQVVALNYSDAQLGKAVLNALDNFDSHAPTYESWQNKELGKQLCSWLGARSIPAA